MTKDKGIEQKLIEYSLQFEFGSSELDPNYPNSLGMIQTEALKSKHNMARLSTEIVTYSGGQFCYNSAHRRY